ncbi:MarR family transcriptional regulator [Psychromarinibacter sp. C21-152]|uniref:MarR family transcriptional regulator n=1 Tax=Psychromarinibacter sediminicola TaxID=3033385 RepID=A0AAE3T9F6_9RHOB|nr:MarR family transcriptional regulator [Psychromarinibacter sediminicola]MDF0602540.1 MarR family transcriptional regulator [Psychromarinibacter sediminicola]
MPAAAVELSDDETLEFGELMRSPGFLLRLAQVQSFDLFFDRLAKHGLKPGEFTVLWVIGLNPGLRQGVAARKLRIKPAHMTKLVQRMVTGGYVERTVPDTDRRSVRLQLTQKGEAFVAKHRAAFLEFHEAERLDLSEDEFDTLMRLLAKLTGIEGRET